MSHHSPQVAEWRTKCLQARLAPSTLSMYGAAVRAMEATVGAPLSYSRILEYMYARHEHLSAARLRTYKCAAVFSLSVEGTPLSKEQVDDLNKVIEGIECEKGVPRGRRGAPSERQLKDLFDKAMADQAFSEACAIVIGDGCAMRPRDLVNLKVRDVDLNEKVVWVEPKARRIVKVRQGNRQPRPIGTYEALETLRILVEGRRDEEQALHGLSLTRLSGLVREAATHGGWEEDLLWTGAHNLRHGRAASIARQKWQELREAGSWRSAVAERVYGLQGRSSQKNKRMRTDE